MIERQALKLHYRAARVTFYLGIRTFIFIYKLWNQLNIRKENMKTQIFCGWKLFVYFVGFISISSYCQS